MADQPNYAVRSGLAASEWIPVQCPIACNYWIVQSSVPGASQNSDSLFLTTDQNNEAAIVKLPAGAQEGIISKENPVSGTKFPANTIFCWIKAQSGSSAYYEMRFGV